MKAGVSIKISEESALHFRARRSFLAGSRAPNTTAAARAILGAQAQYEGYGMMALSLRTEGSPTVTALRAQLFEDSQRRLVRAWGQRDTVHIYDPADWNQIAIAQAAWPQSGRRGGMPRAEDIKLIRRVFETSDAPLLRTDLFDHIPADFLAEAGDHPAGEKDPHRFAATRLIWSLCVAGAVCAGEKQGSEQSYVHRALWFPDLEWEDLDPERTAIYLVDRYLQTFAPATAADVAHFFGAKVAVARRWLKALDLVAVQCGDRKGLVARREDVEALQASPDTPWPARLLGPFDSHLMTHKDKSWVLPNEDERPRVWRKGAHLSAVVLVRGRFVATWTHSVKRDGLRIEISPMSGWDDALKDELSDDAERLAHHLETTLAEVTVS